MKCMLVGAVGAGKTRLLENMALKSTLNLSEVSRIVDNDNEGVRVIFRDTHGAEKQRSMIPAMFRDIHLCFLVHNPKIEQSIDAMCSSLMECQRSTQE